MPRKWPGRKRPSSLLAIAGGSTMYSCGSGYISFSSGWNTTRAAIGGELVAVVLEGARILVEVLALAELQAVDEDRRDHEGRVLLRDRHQPQVPVVDVAHGGHAGHPRLALEPLAQLLDRFGLLPSSSMTAEARRLQRIRKGAETANGPARSTASTSDRGSVSNRRSAFESSLHPLCARRAFAVAPGSQVPRLKNSRGPRISLMRRNNKAKSAGRSTKFRFALLTISSGAPV